jgi:acyl-coenzyme A thioesterase PaaI-like protein
MHGGIAAAILDETIGRSICNGKDEQIWGVTLELKTKFRKPIPLGRELKIVGHVTSKGNRFLKVPEKLFSQTEKSPFLPRENI